MDYMYLYKMGITQWFVALWPASSMPKAGSVAPLFMAGIFHHMDALSFI